MSGYLLTVIGTVLLCAVLTAIAPEGKTSSVIKGAARLVCILAIVFPVLQFFKSGSLKVFTDKNRQEFFSNEVIEAEGEFIQYYSEMRVRQTEMALEEELFQKYSISTDVTLDWNATKNIKIDRINVSILNKTDEEVKRDMWRYLTDNYCSEVLIE